MRRRIIHVLKKGLIILGSLYCLAGILFLLWLAGTLVLDYIRNSTRQKAVKPVAAATQVHTVPAPSSTVPQTVVQIPSNTQTPVSPAEILIIEPEPPALSPLAVEALGQEGTFHNVVLFTSSEQFPIHGTELAVEYEENFPIEPLWMIKLDALTFARLSPKWLSSAIDVSGDGPGRIVNFGPDLPTGGVKSLAPPVECIPPAGWDGDPQIFTPCSHFTFSEDGKLLGYAITIHGCASQLRLLDRATNQLVMTINDQGHRLFPLPNGRWLYSTGSCGGGEMAQYDPYTRKATALGPEPMELNWNPQHNAFYADVSNEGGQQVALWGYNAETGRTFFSVSGIESYAFYNRTTWTPDGKALFFEYRQGTLSEDGKKVGFYLPGYLIRVDVASRAQSQILDPAGSLVIVPGWTGDTLMVQRYPFKPLTIDIDAFYFPDHETPAIECGTLGDQCEPAPELLAYNYQTGNLAPWQDTHLPEAPATVFPPTPTLDLEHSLYVDPSGGYQVVFGDPVRASPYDPLPLPWEGYASIWYVPKDGEPILWVGMAHRPVYIP